MIPIFYNVVIELNSFANNVFSDIDKLLISDDFGCKIVNLSTSFVPSSVVHQDVEISLFFSFKPLSISVLVNFFVCHLNHLYI